MLYMSEKYSEAVGYAASAHADQVRKGTDIPYISHPIAVSALVVEHGGNEAQAIAALLHDVLEDCGEHHAPEIAERFGSEILKIVEGLTDGIPDAHGVKPLWRERKERYVAHLENADPDVVLVSTARRGKANRRPDGAYFGWRISTASILIMHSGDCGWRRPASVRCRSQERTPCMFLEQIDLPDVGSEDTSRRWRMDQITGGHIYRIRNVQTGKCLTSAGGGEHRQTT